MRRLIYSAALLLALPGAALAAPALPMALYGSAPGAAGATIEARIDGATVASGVVESGGVYGYAPHLFVVPDASGTSAGKTIVFVVGGVSAQETMLFASGKVAKLDLSLPPVELVSSGTGTSGAGLVALLQATTTLPRVAKSPDLNGDHLINLLDFSFLVGRWGARGAHSAGDFNDDGAINLLDFNYLMRHWTTL